MFDDDKIDEILHKLDEADIMILMGMRRSVGSVNVIPTSKEKLLEAFTKNHKKTKLTVGARAFSKHCVRSSDNWWGICTGNIPNKNKIGRAHV